MENIWRPLDLSAACSLQTAPLEQCSSSGYMFLSLITQLFGGVSYSISYTGTYPYPGEAPNPLPTPSPPVTSFPPTQIPTEPPSLPGSGITANPIGPGNHPPNNVPGYAPNNPPGYLPCYPPVYVPGNAPGYVPGNPPAYVPGNPPGYIAGDPPCYVPGNLPGYVPSNPPSYIPGYIPGSPQYPGQYPRMYSSGTNEPIDFVKLAQTEELGAVTFDDNSTSTKAKQKIHPNIEFYDFVIVGGGSAGCVLANRLSEIKQWSVLLLEAGGEEPDITMVPAFPPTLGGSSLDWNYRTQPDNRICLGHRGQTCSWVRGKTLGGSSAVNYLVYMRGHKLDYDGWADMGNPGWSYDEVLPYFRRSENNRNEEAYDTKYHGVGGPLNVERFTYIDPNAPIIVDAFRQLGLPQQDLTLPNNLGTNIIQFTSNGGRRFSINVAYIRPIRYVRPNLKIILNAYATKVIIDPNTKTAQGVIYYSNGQYFYVRARKEVIVSCGALNSPKLLMLSGIGPSQHLQSFNIPVIADLKVGENLQDHVTTLGLSITLSKTAQNMSLTQLFNEVLIYRSQNQNNGPLSAVGVLSASAFIKTRYAQENAPDIQFHFASRNVEDFYADPQTFMESNIIPLSTSRGLSANPILITPKSRGRVMLNTTHPVFGQPLIYPGFFTVQKDVDVLVEGLVKAVELEQTETFRRNGIKYVRTPMRDCKQYVWGSYDYFSCLLFQYTFTMFHPVGTCRMGPAWDKTAVVDSRLRVYGIKYLRVIDAGIMPKIIRGNTNAPVVMIAEKAADLIKEDWGVSTFF